MANEIVYHKCPLCGPSPYNVPAVNHTLHFLITVLSCGLWAFVWIFLAATRGKATCGSCGLPVKSAYRKAKKQWKRDVKEDRRLASLEYNQYGPEVGTRAKITGGAHKGKYGTVTANNGQFVTLTDKTGRAMTLPISDFWI